MTLPSGWEFETTGVVPLSYHMVDEIQRTQVASFCTAAVTIFFVVALFFRSILWALATMIPTAVPVIVVLGAMGMWGVYLDMGTAMVAAIVLGIGVDDSVHLVVQYQRRRANGVSAKRAMRESVIHVGRALVTTSVALALGFFALTLSSWESVAAFGFMSGIAIVLAMVADLCVLPACLAIAGRQRRVLGD